MTVQSKLKMWKSFYHAAWGQIADDLRSLLVKNGFTLKGIDIGNVGGEVYAYTDESIKAKKSLYLIRIAPTPTGKLTIKLTYDDKFRQKSEAGRIEAALSIRPFVKSEPAEGGRFGMTYFFLSEEPPADAKVAGQRLLDAAQLWLEVITAD